MTSLQLDHITDYQVCQVPGQKSASKDVLLAIFSNNMYDATFLCQQIIFAVCSITTSLENFIALRLQMAKGVLNSETF